MYDKANPLRIGVLLFEGFELLDVFGPLEMFGLLSERVRIAMLAEQAGSIRSTPGPAALAEASIHEPRELDLLLVPGGIGTRREVSNAKLIEALARQCHASRYVASVCTGSALLARAGVLDGHRATSNKRAFAWASSQGPKVDWIRQARWVEDGKYFTSSGVSAGIDMALALIARLIDRDAAIEAANRAEYQWQEDAGRDPFARLNGLV